MHFSSTVETTKFLRDRSKDLLIRVDVALQLLNGELDVILPRKESVILEWCFDMLATDPSAKTSNDMWSLVLRVWLSTPNSGRLRVFKNHKFTSNVSDALQTGSQELVDLVLKCTLLISETVPILSYATDGQACNLVLAYLSNNIAVENPELGHFIFESVKSRSKIFGKAEPSALELIFREPIVERKSHYLVDYLSTSSNSVLPDSSSPAKSLQLLVDALCEADVLVKERFIALCTSFPEHIQEMLSTLHAKLPGYVNAELLAQILAISFSQKSLDWALIEQCLRINAAPLLENPEYMARIMSSNTSLPDSTMSLILIKMAQLRRLIDFLPTWNPPAPISSKLFDAVAKSIDSLSPLQVANIIGQIAEKPNLLELVVRALSYQVASSPAVSAVLEPLLTDKTVVPSVKTSILEVLPQTAVRKPKKLKESDLIFRAVELNGELEKKVSSAVSKITDYDHLLLRYFPLLDKSPTIDKELITQIVHNASESTRILLASSATAMECPRITASIIDTSIINREIAVLSRVPKQVFDWSQRHKAVSATLTDRNSFSLSAGVVIKLLDNQNFPPAADLGAFLQTASPNESDIDMVLSIVQMTQKDTSYIEQALGTTAEEWLKHLVYSQLIDKSSPELRKHTRNVMKWVYRVYKDSSVVEPVLAVLSLLPSDSDEVKDVARKLSLDAVTHGKPLHRKLFQILCKQNYHWSVITAMFLCSQCEHVEEDYAEYCKSLEKKELQLLLFTAVEESQYAVLTTLANHRLIPTDDSIIYKNHHAVTVAIVKATVNISPQFWNFCDAVIREYPTLLSQFSLETLLELVAQHGGASEEWNKLALIISRFLLLKRRALRHRLHLVTAALTELLHGVDSLHKARLFTRLVDNLCNPPQMNNRSRSDKQELSSHIAKERRHVAKHAGVLLQNLVLVILHNTSIKSEWNHISTELRQAGFLLVDMIYGDGLKAVSAGMDNASRAYLRSIFEDYKLHGRWSSD